MLWIMSCSLCRMLVTADQPWSGHFLVNRITWAIAQTTQFAAPGWRHITGANKELGDSGSYNSYEAPNGKDWIEDNGSQVMEVADFSYSKATLNPIRIVLAAQTVEVGDQGS